MGRAKLGSLGIYSMRRRRNEARVLRGWIRSIKGLFMTSMDSCRLSRRFTERNNQDMRVYPIADLRIQERTSSMKERGGCQNHLPMNRDRAKTHPP